MRILFSIIKMTASWEINNILIKHQPSGNPMADALYVTWYSTYSVFSHFHLLLVLFRSQDLHLTMFAIEIQTEALAIGTYQVVWFAEGRLLLVTNRTPTHAITKAMLAEHQYGICSRTLLESRSNLRYSMLAIEGC